MTQMIKTAEDFQYSVNIAYDLYNAEKLKGFIPTLSSLELLEQILLSTDNASKNRARILIGAYGKGKSHIVLTILSILRAHEPRKDFIHLNKKLAENPQLKQLVKNYYDSGKKLLPVLITGSGTSLSQSFLVSLKNTLSENGLSDFMPETNYKAAILAIQKWQSDYPEVFKKFEKLSEESAVDFVSKLKDFNIDYYHKFEEIYPSLTAGSIFNPFLGFDVVELYESVAKELRHQNLYDGLYVVYDEFSKYLESNIESASVSDTKMLQDFAEKSCRSGENQLHLLLISHKEISNYIDKLPKQKTDGWRGISERFEHILLNNNFSQVYEIISSVIQKDEKLWSLYKTNHKELFDTVCKSYKTHELFKEVSRIESLFDGTFPLHPISTFILPRLSERIAQNERTLFTFLSAKGDATLPAFLEGFNDTDFTLVTPDLIFDYFEPLFKKEIYSGELHDIYHLTSVILEKLGNISKDEKQSRNIELERKIIKTISLIYILAQFEKLKPLQEEIVRIYSFSYSKQEIETVLKNLIEKEFVIYLRQSNSYLKLKETSGVDIAASVHDEVEKQKRNFSLAKVLNAHNEECFLYPYRYNDEKEMTRYFEFIFFEASAIAKYKNIDSIAGNIKADGAVFGIICSNQDECEQAKHFAMQFNQKKSRFVFVILKTIYKIENAARDLNALNELHRRAAQDEILSNECQVVLDDLSEVVSSFIKNYTHPEKKVATYIYDGTLQNINRRSELSELLSIICNNVYNKTPIINNESINKNEITSMAFNSRRKILAGLLRNPLEKNLGLTGTGQDVAIMRSTLRYTKILIEPENSEYAELNLDFDSKNDEKNLKPMIEAIKDFAKESSENRKSFSELYNKLLNPENEIGMRRGVIPIYIAAVFGEIKKQLVLYSGERQIALNADSLALIDEHPEEYSLLRFYLDDEKTKYLQEVKRIFDVQDSSKNEKTDAEILYTQMQRWYLSLPKYSREAKTIYSSFLKVFKENSGEQETLFVKLPAVFNSSTADFNTALSIEKAKTCYDNLIFELKNELREELLTKFSDNTNKPLYAVLKAWLALQNVAVKNHLFKDGTERFVSVIQESFKHDEDLIEELAVIATDLHLSDWNDNTKKLFFTRIDEWKNSVEFFQRDKHEIQSEQTTETLDSTPNSYSIRFPTPDGKIITRSFEKLSESPCSKLLYNKITDSIETMGRSMTDAEKRQVLMRILEEMC